jgi:tetratricopeptide (TPR) repeat protein
MFFCNERQGPEREIAYHQLARAMKVPPAQIEGVLKERNCVIMRNLTAAIGQEAVTKLRGIGIRCNLRPASKPPVVLALMPLETPKANEPVRTCPACGHLHPGEGDTPAPTICEACGTVFAKYERVEKDRKERELIRQTLLAKNQRQLENAEKEREARAASKRRKTLEEEILRELGLPRSISTRFRLINSVVAIYLVGLAVGVVAGVTGYKLLEGSDPTANQQNTLAMEALTASQAAAGHYDPGVQVQMQVIALLATKPAGGGRGITKVTATDAAKITPGPLSNSGLAVKQGASTLEDGNTPTSSADKLIFMDRRLSELKTDTEWNLLLLGRMEFLREQGELQSALALIDSLNTPETRLSQGVLFAESLLGDGRSVEAGELYQRLTADAKSQPDQDGKRIAALSDLARHLHGTGQTREAEALLQQAQTILGTLQDPADKVLAESEIAALLSYFGRLQQGQTAFNRATSGLAQIPDLKRRLSTIILLAQTYAKAGYRASALSLLETVADRIDTVQDQPGRVAILGKIAQAYQQLGDLQGAEGAAARIADPTRRDEVIYRLLMVELAAGRLANAMELTERLKQPVFRTLAFALLSLRQKNHSDYQALAKHSGERALLALESIANPLEKAAVSAELGRYSARQQEDATADWLFAQALQFAEEGASVAERDRILAIIATNEALALRGTPARAQVAKIADAQLRVDLTGEFDRIESTAKTAGL